ncbi:AI-2E family transporter [Streptomyces sp. RM72]|uniref:AI-2E family transporter n=1 Tax=Streptomyces sp. RM72 TaxID=1115510 RepID=UPI001B36B1CE|nr:AI-2E family transporter [Streptomyces sp. RM72]
MAVGPVLPNRGTSVVVRFGKWFRRPGAGARREVAADEPQRVPDRAIPVSAPTAVARPGPADAVPWGIRVAAEVVWRLLVVAAGVWVVARALGSVRVIVFAFVASLLISALLQPTVARLHRHRVPKGPATVLTALCGFVLLGLVGWFVAWQVMSNVGELSDRLQDGTDDLKRWLADGPFHVTESQLDDATVMLRDSIGSSRQRLTDVGIHGVTILVELLTGALLALFSTLFLLYDGPRIWAWSLKWVPASARPKLAGAGVHAWRTLTAYVHGTVVIAFIDALCIGLGIFVLGVPLALPLAVVVFLGAFVPLVGAVVSGALAVVVAFVTEGVFTALLVLVIVLGVQQLEGHILQPFILGRAVRVHPLGIIFSVAAGGLVAGIGGAVVAVPLVAVLNTMVGALLHPGGAEELPAAERAAHGR